MQRKDEILAKKAKLAELRRQREEREQRQKEGKRESLLAEPSEVYCPYYEDGEGERLILARPEDLLRGPQIGKSLILSSTPS